MAGARTAIAGGKRGLEKKEPGIRTFAICSTGPRFIAQPERASQARAIYMAMSEYEDEVSGVLTVWHCVVCFSKGSVTHNK